MDISIDVDGIWAAFCDTLPTELQQGARDLAFELGLTPVPDIPWSRVFKNEVTVAAPALFTPAMPQVSSSMVVAATTAHMLAVIAAFAIDRILDCQVASSAKMLGVLDRVRVGRDQAICGLMGTSRSPYLDTEREVARAITRERLLLQCGGSLSFADYFELSLAKQAAAFPASLALAGAAGLDGRHRRAIQHVLRAITLGLQFHDDVVDWEDDCKEGGAWAVSLSRDHNVEAVQTPDGAEGKPDMELLRRRVHQSGVLATMMNLAWRRYHDAHRLAISLEVIALADWARQQEATMAELAEHERDHAGYVVRAHQLSSWALELFA